MATRFPGDLDRDPNELPDNVADSDTLNSPNHATIHNNVNGAVLQIEEKLGTGDTTPASGAVLIGTGTGTSAWDTTPTFVDDVTIPEGDLILGSTAVTSTAAELNILDGVTATASELNILDGVTSTTAELNILDGVTSTAAELNILDGVTSTAAELNILDGVTSTASELNILDGVTSTTAELNILDGVTSTAAELNILDGSTTAWTSFTADWTDGITVGNGVNEGKYLIVGDVCFLQLEFKAGSSTSYSSNAFDLGISASGLPASVSDLDYVHVGAGWARMTASGTIYELSFVIIQSGQVIIPYARKKLGTDYTGVTSCKAGVPSTWGTASRIYMSGSYRI